MWGTYLRNAVPMNAHAHEAPDHGQPHWARHGDGIPDRMWVDAGFPSTLMIVGVVSVPGVGVLFGSTIASEIEYALV